MKFEKLNYKLKWVLIFALTISVSIIQAQDKLVHIDKLYLNNGSIIHGTLVNYNENGDITMIISNGNEIFVPADRIKKIKTKQRNANSNLHNEIDDAGLIHTLDLTFMSPNLNGRNEYYIGTAVNYSMGYRFDRLFGIGIATGWETYSLGAKEHFIPIKLDIISYLTNRYQSPFVRFQYGYSYFVSTDKNLAKSSGGWLLNPSFGWRLDGRNDLNYFIEFGYKTQKANIITECVNNDCIVVRREQELLFRRFNFKFGVNF